MAAVLMTFSGTGDAQQPQQPQQQQPPPPQQQSQPGTGITVLHPVYTQSINLGLGNSVSIVTDKPVKSLQIIDPNVLDAIVQTDRNVILVPKALGMTSVNIYDQANALFAELHVVVDEAGPSRVEVHNKALVSSATIYRCSPNGCRYIDELTVKEPAPLPPTETIIRSNDRNLSPSIQIPTRP